MRRRISQAEARRTARELAALKERDRVRGGAWASEYPGGAHLFSIDADYSARLSVQTARRLDHAVVVIQDGASLKFYGVKA